MTLYKQRLKLFALDDIRLDMVEKYKMPKAIGKLNCIHFYL